MADFIDSTNVYIGESEMSDEHQIINIINKTPIPGNIGKIVRGDNNSNILTFEMKRYYDGVDLSDKDIKILVDNGKDDVFADSTVNLKYTDDLIRFSWILNSASTRIVGKVKAACAISGSEDGKDYVLKTTPFIIDVVDTLDMSDLLADAPVDWVTRIENRLGALENSFSNRNILAKFSESPDGELLYDGDPVSTDMGVESDPVDWTSWNS